VTTKREARPEWPAVGGLGAGRLVLKDGSAVLVRPTTPEDLQVVRQFFAGLSAASLYNRFLSHGQPADPIVASFCDSSNPADRLSLVAMKQAGGALNVVGLGSYAASGDSADVGVAVSDDLQGKGLGTALLERLAESAATHGIERFRATALPSNESMLEVLHDSGFSLRSKTTQGTVELQLDLRPSPRTVLAMDERDRVATVASLRFLLRPRAVAVLGVSRRSSNLGRRIFNALIRGGFAGPVYPVNPNADDIDGFRCYASVGEAPPGVDLAVIAAPAPQVLRLVDECARAGVRSLVVISAGFAEAGDAGRELQARLVEAVRRHGMRLVGPNCMGVLNLTSRVRLNASFADRLPEAGRLALASQSGGVGLALLELACARRLGLSTFVSLGNKADVSGNDLLQWGESDPDTSVILLYLESFGNPRRFAQLARRVGRSKPIVVVKAGRTRSGSRAAGSHTAGLASSEAAVSALFRQTGVIRVDTIDEMFDVAELLDLQPLPSGPRVAIITNAGGPGILAADACEGAGLVVHPFGPSTEASLAAGLPGNASLGNPIDLVASAGPAAYDHAIVTALGSSDVDSLIVIYTPIDHAQSTAILEGIGRAIVTARAARSTKPVVLCVLDGATQPAPLRAGAERVPAYMFPENAVRALGRATAYGAWRGQPQSPCWTFDDLQLERARAVCRAAAAGRGDTWLSPDELRQLLEACGLGSVANGTAHSEDEAVTLASGFGYPVVLKVQSPRVLHKTEAGGVRLHLHDERALREAFRDVCARFPAILSDPSTTNVCIQPMLAGVETLVGVTQDPQFGPLVGFGLGGVNTELLRDVAFRIAPLSDRDVDALLHEVRSFPLLEGYRGKPAGDVGSLREALLRVSALAQGVPELKELDLNPLMVMPSSGGCRVVDARARVAPAG